MFERNLMQRPKLHPNLHALCGAYAEVVSRLPDVAERLYWSSCKNRCNTRTPRIIVRAEEALND